MARPHFASVDEYLAAQPAPAQAVLQRVRAAIRKALPDADEVISYQIPTYKLDGKAVLYFAGFKEHFSLYPVGQSAVAALGDEVRRRVVSKGTMRFAFDEPVPLKLVERVAKFRAQESAAKKPAKRAAKKSAKKAAKKR